MSISVMEKMTVIAPQEESDALLRTLMRLGAISLSPPEEIDGEKVLPPQSDRATCAARLARIEAALPLLARYSRRKKRLFDSAEVIDTEVFLTRGRDRVAWKTIAETEELVQKQNHLKEAIEAETARMRALTPYLSLTLPLCFEGTKTSAFVLGALPRGIRLARVQAALAGLAAEMAVVNADKSGVCVSLLVHKSDLAATEQVLASFGFVRAPFEGETRTAAALFETAKHTAEQYREELRALDRRFADLAHDLFDVEALYDIERSALLAEENKQKLAATKTCVIFSGWCPKKARARVEKALARFTAAYDFSPPDEGDDVPILLKNNGFARNFEWVLGMYSYPKYGRFDPTLLMSIFYFLIFGLMFADAGYGLVLTLACFFLVAKCKPREGMKRFLLMFGYCGISSIIFGVIFGSYFGNFPLAFAENVLGIAPEQLPNLAYLTAAQANLALLLDPLQNPMGFLVISLGVGAIHLLAGMAVKAFILCRDGHPLAALFDVGSYWLLFAGIITVFFNRNVGFWLIVGGAVAIVATQGRHNKGIVMKILGGFGGIYELINLASDLLSYSRVLALGLAASVIGQVVNVMATLNGGSFLGFIAMIAIFCVGHLLNLVINVLGTFVHTARLQYIEFFGKFYEDGGTPFVPIKNSERYTVERPHTRNDHS